MAGSGTSGDSSSDVELVVLLDEAGQPCGTAPKAEVHHTDTPLHLAFSCWLVDDQGRTLLTRRAEHKRTWPGVWTNSFCGHPGPGEPVEDAVHRRAKDELGTTISDVVPLLPEFRYRAVMTDGTVENEVCPVYLARLASAPQPSADEVADVRWVPLDELAGLAQRGVDGHEISPWMRDQLAEIEAAGGLSAALATAAASRSSR